MLVGLVVLLIIAGAALTLFPTMDLTIRRLIIFVCVVAVLLAVLSFLGVFPGVHGLCAR